MGEQAYKLTVMPFRGLKGQK